MSLEGYIPAYDGSPYFPMTCTDLLAGRLFPGATRDVYDRSSLKPGVMYYEQEGKGNGNHPIADYFFRSDANQLVLINVTGAARGKLKSEESSWSSG